jgi:hypothetical protein
LLALGNRWEIYVVSRNSNNASKGKMRKLLAVLASLSVMFTGLVSAAPSSAVGSANPTFTTTSYQATVGVSFFAQLRPTFNNLNGPAPTFASGGRATLNTTVCDALPAGLQFPEDEYEWDYQTEPTYNISGTPSTGSQGTYSLCFDTETDEGSGLTAVGTSEVFTLVVGTSVPVDAPTDYTIDCQVSPSDPFDASGSLFVELDGAQEYTKTVRIKGCANHYVDDSSSPIDVFVGPGTNVVYTLVIPAETYATASGSNPSWISPANAYFTMQINNFESTDPVDPDPTTYSLGADYDSISEGEAVAFTTDAPSENLGALFLDGTFIDSGSIGSIPNPFPWDGYGDCGTDTVMTLRVYDEASDPDGDRDVSWDEDYAATVSVTLNSGCELLIEHDLELLAEIGDTADGSEAEYSAIGLLEDSTWTLTLRSTPIVLATGTVPEDGEIDGTVVIPAGLEAGWHSITLAGTDTNGDSFTDVVWFEVDANGIILAIVYEDPVAALASTGADRDFLFSSLVGCIAAMLVGVLLMATRRREASIDA